MPLYNSESEKIEIIYNTKDEELQNAYNADGEKIYEKTSVLLTGISSTYTGGIVPAGTTLHELNGVTVTAHYSDGTSQNILDYSMSGSLLSGTTNTITVEYKGFSSTFEVEVEGSVSGYQFYVPGIDNAPLETDISSIPSNASGWYAAYDSLMEQTNRSGNYSVTRNIDVEGSPRGVSTNGTDLRYYVFVPKTGSYEKTYFLQAGTHSSEKNALLSCLRICTILCTIDLTKSINETLKYVCQNVRFIVNPLANPSMGLTNENGVQTNRNYDGWWGRAVGNSESGDYPFSEPEMRFVRDIILYFGEDNIHAGLDMHNGAGSSEDYWVGYVYNLPQMEENVRKIVAKCVYDDINGSNTAYLPDNFTDDNGNLVTDMVGGEFTVSGVTYKTPHCKDTSTSGNVTNFMYRALNVPIHTCEVLKYEYLGLGPGDASVLNKSVKIYMNDILMDLISNYPRLSDSMDETKPFRIKWCGGNQEKYFSSRKTVDNITTTSPNCSYSFRSPKGIDNAYRNLAANRRNDFQSALATGEIAEMGGSTSNTEDAASYDKLLTPSDLQITGSNGTIGYYSLIPDSGSYAHTIILYGGNTTNYNSIINLSNGIIYKFLKILRDYSDKHSLLNSIRNSCRIIVIPPLACDGYTERMGALTAGDATNNLKEILNDIYGADLFVYFWTENDSGNGYVYTNTDSDGNYLERIAVADTSSSFGIALAEKINAMNANEVSSVRYELKGEIYGSSESVKSGILSMLKSTYHTNGARVMLSIDPAAYAMANERFMQSTGTETASTGVSRDSYERLNDEIARRVSLIANLIEVVI